MALTLRILLLAALFTAELLYITIRFDNAALLGRAGLTGAIGTWGAVILRGLVGFVILLAGLLWIRREHAGAGETALPGNFRLNPLFALGHLLAMTAFLFFSAQLYQPGTPNAANDTWLALAWVSCGVTGIVSGAFAAINPAIWHRLLRHSGWISIYSFAGILFACATSTFSRSLWPLATGLTFAMSKRLLSLAISGVTADPVRSLLAAPHFSVEIAPQCSGLEGVSLMLAFSLVALVVFRRDYQFPRALLLIPVGMVLIFLANSVRITALILIGEAGYEKLAEGGFHSQAGWLMFIGISLGLVSITRRMPWMRKHAPGPARSPASPAPENPLACWLLPFLGILATGMVSNLFSTGFAWLYPLQVITAIALLWRFRGRYQQFDWGFTWQAPAAGVVVFLIWLALEPALHRTGQPAALSAAALPLQILWLTFRVAGGVFTVPLAEELAFRGYLFRRLLGEDFESENFASARGQQTKRVRFCISLLASSLVFGVMHGDRWFAGILAGVCYGLLYARTGKLAAPVIAHATTNALIACCIPLFGYWNLW